MEHIIEHPHWNATKTVKIEAAKVLNGFAYRIEILEQNYSGKSNMYSDKTTTLVLFEEELEGLILALTKARTARLLGIK